MLVGHIAGTHLCAKHESSVELDMSLIAPPGKRDYTQRCLYEKRSKVPD